MNGDPLLVGFVSIFPNQNSSSAPTEWVEDTDQAAQQGIPCATGPMLRLTKRSNNLPLLPGGAINPCPETGPLCLIVENIRMNAGVVQRLSASLIAAGLVGSQAIGGMPAAPGIGAVGVGAPGDGVRGLSVSPVLGGGPTGHGVSGLTHSTSNNHAGVMGEMLFGRARGVMGRNFGLPPGSGLFPLVTQAVRGEGGTIAVCGEGRTQNQDGTPAPNSWGVVGTGITVGVEGRGFGATGDGVRGVGGAAGVRGGNPTFGGIGVIGVSGPNFISGGIPLTPWAGRFDGPVRILTTGAATGNLSVDGSLFVSGPVKASVVLHPDGSQRIMHTVEAPERWFEDIGRAQLRGGAARVDIDPDFAAVSGLGDDYHVFLTAEGPSNGLYVGDRTPTGFEVREQGETTGEISFSYRIVTKRATVGMGRLMPIELPTGDGQRAPAEPPPPAPAQPGSLEDAEDIPPALPEEAMPGPPSDWPESVPWPPDNLVDINDGNDGGGQRQKDSAW
jgi:hypothetical protein